MYEILIDEDLILFIKQQLINLSESINVDNKTKYIDMLVDDVLIYSFKLIKKNPKNVLLFKAYLYKIISLINKPNLIKKKIKY